MGVSSQEVFPTNVLSHHHVPILSDRARTFLRSDTHQLLAPKHPTSFSLRGEVARPSSFLLKTKREREKVERGRKPSGEPHWWRRRQGSHHHPLSFLRPHDFSNGIGMLNYEAYLIFGMSLHNYEAYLLSFRLCNKVFLFEKVIIT